MLVSRLDDNLFESINQSLRISNSNLKFEFEFESNSNSNVVRKKAQCSFHIFHIILRLQMDGGMAFMNGTSKHFRDCVR